MDPNGTTKRDTNGAGLQEVERAARELAADEALPGRMGGSLYERAFATPTAGEAYDTEILDLGACIQRLCARGACGVREKMVALAFEPSEEFFQDVGDHAPLQQAALELARAVAVYFFRVEAYWRADAKR